MGSPEEKWGEEGWTPGASFYVWVTCWSSPGHRHGVAQVGVSEDKEKVILRTRIERHVDVYLVLRAGDSMGSPRERVQVEGRTGASKEGGGVTQGREGSRRA